MPAVLVSPGLTGGHLLPMPSRGLPSVCVCILTLSYTDAISSD